jgi:hypothetical protein
MLAMSCLILMKEHKFQMFGNKFLNGVKEMLMMLQEPTTVAWLAV